jgi:hypothetical protein
MNRPHEPEGVVFARYALGEAAVDIRHIALVSPQHLQQGDLPLPLPAHLHLATCTGSWRRF